MDPREMHAVVVSSDARVTGGAASVAVASAIALADAGVHVHFFAGQGPVDATLASRERVAVTCLERSRYQESGARGLLTGLWDGEPADELARVLEPLPRGRTLVHFHTFVENLSGSVTRVPRQKGVPALFSLHEYGLACPYGGFYNHRTRRPCGRRALSAGCVATRCSTAPYPRKLWRVARLAVQKARGGAPLADAWYLCVSEFCREVMAGYLPRGARLEVVRNPIEVENLGPADVASSEVFLYLGRITEEKGAEVLAAAAGPAGVRAQFVGDGTLRENLARAYPSCEFAGWLAPADARAALRASRALVFPSRLWETLGMAVSEAAAAGVPSIVSDSAAAARSIEPGVTGLVFRSGDADSLGEALRAMTPDAAARMGAEVYRRYWQDPPTLERHVERLLEIYSEALGA